MEKQFVVMEDSFVIGVVDEEELQLFNQCDNNSFTVYESNVTINKIIKHLRENWVVHLYNIDTNEYSTETIFETRHKNPSHLFKLDFGVNIEDYNYGPYIKYTSTKLTEQKDKELFLNEWVPKLLEFVIYDGKEDEGEGKNSTPVGSADEFCTEINNQTTLYSSVVRLDDNHPERTQQRKERSDRMLEMLKQMWGGGDNATN